MKSIDFLTEHFLTYEPKDPYIYISFIYLFETRDVLNVESLHSVINETMTIINKNDINLLANFSLDFSNVDLSSKLSIIFMKMFPSMIFESIIMNELSSMLYHQNDVKKIFSYKSFQYFLPFDDFDFKPYRRFKPNIYYFIRKQFFNMKQEDIIDKLEYDEQFKYYIISRFIDDSRGERITNRNIFQGRIYSEFFAIAERMKSANDEAIDAYHKDWELYKGVVLERFYGKLIS